MRTNEEVMAEMILRRQAWESSTELVTPVVDKHGIEPYSVNENLFVRGSTMTPVDQHVDQIINVANWLLEPLT